MESSKTRKAFIGGNWKSNNTLAQTKDLVTKVVNHLEFDTAHVEVCIAPVFVHIPWVAENADKKVIVAAQNTSLNGFGAFTGEITAEHVKDFGINWTIIGHSERRQLFGETDETTAKKTRRALDAGLSVIFCFGEVLAEREAGKTLEVVTRQLNALKGQTKPEDWSKIVLAYEPVWAIGTGKNATPDQAQEVHSVVRGWITKEVSAEVAGLLRIIYGGSVKDTNADVLIQQPDVDGFLVGGASLNADFAKIVTSVNNHAKTGGAPKKE